MGFVLAKEQLLRPCPQLCSFRWDHLPPGAGLAGSLALLSADKAWQHLSHPITPDGV